MPRDATPQEARLAHEPTQARFISISAYGGNIYALDEDGWIWVSNLCGDDWKQLPMTRRGAPPREVESDH